MIKYWWEMWICIFCYLALSNAVRADHNYEYRLTNKNMEVEVVVYFSTYEDCQSARAIAEHFNYWATCSKPKGAKDE